MTKFLKNNNYVYFQIKEEPNKQDCYNLIKRKFEKQKFIYKSYKDFFSIPNKLRNKLPKSFDIIGDIILIKLPELKLRE